MRFLTRRSILLGAIVAAALSTGARAADFPTKPVTLIVPWPAGGSTDLAMRAIADSAEKHLGQKIVIDNRPGASGTLGGAQMAATAKPDGYTVAQIPITIFRLPFMSKTSFDPAKDFTYIVGLTGYTFGIVVRKEAPWKTFEEMLAFAKANPGKVKYGSPGAGTSLHITMEQIAKQQGIKWIHVPFKGGAETNAALLGGHIDAIADSTSWAPLVNAGDFRLLVTWGAQRTKTWPNVPTLQESGVNIVSNSPFGLGGPKGMDPRVVKELHDAFKKGLEEPAAIEGLAKFDMVPFYLGTEQYQKFAAQQIAEQKQLVEELGLAQK